MDRLKDILDQFKKKNIYRTDEAESNDILGLFSSIPVSGKISGTEKGASKIFAEITINPATKNIRIDYSGNEGSGYASSQISFSDFPEGIVKIGQSATSIINGIFIKILNYYLYDKNNNLIKTLNTSNQDEITAFRDYYSYTISWS